MRSVCVCVSTAAEEKNYEQQRTTCCQGNKPTLITLSGDGRKLRCTCPEWKQKAREKLYGELMSTHVLQKKIQVRI